MRAQASAQLAAGPRHCRPMRERRMGRREAQWGARPWLGPPEAGEEQVGLSSHPGQTGEE